MLGPEPILDCGVEGTSLLLPSVFGVGARLLQPLPSHLGCELGGWAETAARAAHLPVVSWQRLCPRGRRGKGREERRGVATDNVKMGGGFSGSLRLGSPFLSLDQP